MIVTKRLRKFNLKTKIRLVKSDNKTVTNTVSRIKNMPTKIFYSFFISIFLILITELWLKNIEAPIKLFFTIGSIILNVCYSIIAASIFFFVNQHLPKEDKIVQTSRYITNRMMHFHYEIQSLQNILKLKTRFKLEDLSEEIKTCCSQINPNEKIKDNNYSNKIFKNWYDYLEFKTTKFIKYLDDILPFYEGMNDDLLESLLNLKDSVRLIQYKLEENPRNLKSLIFLSTEFENLFENHLKSNKIIRVNYKEYLNESNEIQNKENEKREREKKDIQSHKNKKLDEQLNRRKK